MLGMISGTCAERSNFWPINDMVDKRKQRDQVTKCFAPFDWLRQRVWNDATGGVLMTTAVIDYMKARARSKKRRKQQLPLIEMLNCEPSAPRRSTVVLW